MSGSKLATGLVSGEHLCWRDLSFVGREGTQGSAHSGRGSRSLPGVQGVVSTGVNTKSQHHRASLHPGLSAARVEGVRAVLEGAWSLASGAGL